LCYLRDDIENRCNFVDIIPPFVFKIFCPFCSLFRFLKFRASFFYTTAKYYNFLFSYIWSSFSISSFYSAVFLLLLSCLISHNFVMQLLLDVVNKSVVLHTNCISCLLVFYIYMLTDFCLGLIIAALPRLVICRRFNNICTIDIILIITICKLQA